MKTDLITAHDRPTSEEGTALLFPGRRHFALLAMVLLALAAYGSFVPLELRPMPLETALRRSLALLRRPFNTVSRTDLATNVLLFVPIGFSLLAALTLEQPKRWRIAMAILGVLVVCSLASLLIEFAQNWFRRRTPSVFDIAAQFVGTLVGMALWLVAGKPIVAWLRTHSPKAGGHLYLGWALKLYLLGLLVYSLLPFDLSIHPRDLRDKYLRGEIVLRPFSEAQGLQLVHGLIASTAAFVPVGMLTSILFTTRDRPLRPIVASLGLGALLVVLLCGTHLLVAEKIFKTTDLIAGMAGVAIGTWAIRHWIAAPRTAAAPRMDDDARENRLWAYFLFAVLYAVFLVAIFCDLPTEGSPVVLDGKRIEQKLRKYISPPFSSLYRNRVDNAAKEVVRKVGLFLPLGVLLGLGVRALRVPPNIRRIVAAGVLLATLGLAIGIEMIQVFMPNHTPDLTDTLLYLAGAGAGFAIGIKHWLRQTTP